MEAIGQAEWEAVLGWYAEHATFADDAPPEQDDLDEAGCFDLDEADLFGWSGRPGADPGQSTTVAGLLPHEELAAGLATAARGLGQAALTAAERAQVFTPSLATGVEDLGRLRLHLDGILFALTSQAHARGLHTDVGLSLVDWLKVRCPWLATSDATAITAVVTYAATPEGAALGQAVETGRTSLARAALIARTMTRLGRSLDAEGRQAYGTIATEAACNPDLSEKDLGTVARKLLHDLLEDTEPDQRARTAHEQRTITSRRIADGLTRFTIDAPEDTATTLNGILTSALAAPAPSTDEHGTTVPDERTTGQRGFDALITVINRGLGNPGAPPSTARAVIILTMPFDPDQARPTGPPSSTTGEDLDPAQAAKMACSAEITPIWLSPEGGTPIKLGRTARYASPEQFRALVVRDRCCTFPGCTRLPQWCDSHHLDYWSRGGKTDLDRLVLLCEQHHATVHQQELTATVHGNTVTWHV